MTKVHCYAVPTQKHQVDAMNAIGLGVRACGDEIVDEKDADVIVTWGEKPDIGRRSARRLILECGYVNGSSGLYKRDRLRFISTSWDAPHGRSTNARDFDVPSDRWESLGIDIMPWRRPRPPDKRTALVLGQVPGDKAVPDSYSLNDIARHCTTVYHRVVVRGHPLTMSYAPPLAAELSQCDVAVTHSSTAAVEAVLSGVPTVALDLGCTAYPVCSHSIHDPLWLGDRMPWAYNLAYRQWTIDELRDGKAWEWLSNGLATRNESGHRAGQA